MDVLLVAGEGARDAVFDGTKRISIRSGHRNYKVGGRLILCCHILNWATMKTIKSVKWTTLADVTPIEYRDDGFSTWTDLRDGLRKFYPEITDNSPVTIIRWGEI